MHSRWCFSTIYVPLALKAKDRLCSTLRFGLQRVNKIADDPMCRNLFTAVLAFIVALFGTEPAAYGQYGPSYSPDPQYSGQQYPPQYPQAQYRQGPGYPPGPYPQNPYPQAQSYPQNAQSGQYAPAESYSQGSQDPNAQEADMDPQHGVARLSMVQGDVNVRRADNAELVAAVMNAPLMSQDHLQTSPGSRAEVELDYGTLIRLGPNTDLCFANLEYHRYQVQLGAGTIVYRVLRDSNAQAEIDTPNVAVRPAGQGEYRVSVLEDGTTQITLRSGQAEMYSHRGSQMLTAGHTVLVRGDPADPEFQQGYEIVRDQLDDWSSNRDRELLASQSYRYVSRDIYGADDLDAYGDWVPSQYGQVWAPRPPTADWSPYSYGQWTWERYYGWTWVDYAPWGWAPYHYGRWFWNGGHGWCWWPGAIAASYFWSPALVGFFGWGGGLGWVALAPFEFFHPWWRHEPGFGFGGYGAGNFGMLRNANIAGMYRNAGIRGGAMTAGYDGFGGPNRRFSPATREQLANANLFRGQMPVGPTRGSYQFSSRQAAVNPRLASVTNRQFFQHQQPRYQAAAGGTTNGSRFSSAQQSGHSVPPYTQGSYGARGNYEPSPGTAAGGWQRFGDPGTSNAYRQGFTGGQEQSGWHRFGEPQQSTLQQSMPAYNGGSPYSNPVQPNYGGNYQSRPQSISPQTPSPRQGYTGAYGGAYGGGPSFESTPRYSTPSTNYSAPSAPHYNAPSRSYRGGGESRGGGGSSHGGGGGHSGGGGGHSSSGGHYGR